HRTTRRGGAGGRGPGDRGDTARRSGHRHRVPARATLIRRGGLLAATTPPTTGEDDAVLGAVENPTHGIVHTVDPYRILCRPVDLPEDQHAEQDHHDVTHDDRAEEPAFGQALVAHAEVVEHARGPYERVHHHPAQQQPPTRNGQHGQRYQPQRVLRTPHLVGQQERRHDEETQLRHSWSPWGRQRDVGDTAAQRQEQGTADRVQDRR